MKHDRPVSELLDECARELAEPFTRQDILRWFRDHHPDVPPTTIGARIFGLTAGDSPSRDHHQFGGSRPVLERVSRGLYRRAHGRPRQPALFGDVPTQGPARDVLPVGDVLLMGSVRSTVHYAARAADLYTGALYARRVRYAQTSGRPWYVLSGRWGMVAPDEVIVPTDIHFAETPLAYRHGWTAFVLGQLTVALESTGHPTLAGAVVEIHASDAFVDTLGPALDEVGVVLVDPVDARSMSETYAWYDVHQRAR